MYANVFELTKCLADCIEYCEEYPDRRHSDFYLPLLEQAQDELRKTTDRANREFVEWRMESRDDELAWKHLSRKLSNIQDQLASVNAIGYIDQNVSYRNREALEEAVDEMMDYLRERTDDLDFADDEADKLERQLTKAKSEGEESERALDEYLRFSKMRANGLTTTKDTIANFRKALRRDLGRRDETYQSIRWPQQIAPDERVM